jgi:hypothetical protein
MGNDTKSSSTLDLTGTVKQSPISNVCINIPIEYEKANSEFNFEYYKKSDATIMVTSEEIPSYIHTIADYSYHALEQYTGTFDEVKDTVQNTIIVNGRECGILEFKYKINGKTAISDVENSCFIGFIFKDTTVYVISCVSTSLDYFENKSGFEKAVQSVEILDANNSRN